MKNFIIIGCPRSGTGFASQYFNIGHEYMNENGISSWCLVNDPPLYGPSLKQVRKTFKNTKIFHQVRNPIDTISSFFSMSDNAWGYFEKVLKLNEESGRLKNGMLIYYHWNKLCLEISDLTYKLEDIEKKFPIEQNSIDKKTNSRRHPVFTENDFINEDKYLWDKIQVFYNSID